MREREREVVYVQRGGDASAKWFLWGAHGRCRGRALLCADASGEQTRRSLQRRLRKLRAMAEEKMDELSEQLGDRRRKGRSGSRTPRNARVRRGGFEEEEVKWKRRRARPTPRAELEQRLARARSRRRGVADPSEEQGA